MGGRAAGSLAWAGLFNTYFWVDPKQDVCGVLLTQVLPFYDAKAVELLGQFERGDLQAFEGIEHFLIVMNADVRIGIVDGTME